MKKVPSFSLIILIAALFVACGSPRKHAVDRITILEKQLSAKSGKPDTAKVETLALAYSDFVRQFPKDSLSPEYLLRAGGVLMNAGDAIKAIQSLDQITQKYNTSRQAPQALFLLGFIYENMLGNIGKAGESYREFLTRYPKHDLADDAQASLNNLGKTPEELLREFEAKAAGLKEVVTK
ncbi:MAG: tetratricopeptide repeat protein [Bacteroidales bacterium]